MRVLLFLATVVIFQSLISFFFPLMDGPREAGDIRCYVCNKSFKTRSLASDGITKNINFSACERPADMRFSCCGELASASPRDTASFLVMCDAVWRIVHRI